ncbi:hypothetical protein BURK_009416 [Burkholderia sp. SJ98]|nr:hypothetical protein BURK_009416 [Burkholderia sp. SJ98]
MRAEGFTCKRIAAFLSVCPGTIYNDLRYLRVNHPGKLLNLAPVTKLVAMSSLRITRDRHTGIVH